MKPAIIGLLVLGLLLFVASGLWSTMFPVTNSWTPEKSKQLANAKDRLTNIGFIVNNPKGRDTSALKAELAQLTEDDARLTAEFQSAYDRPNTISKFLKWSGISLALVGIIGWYAVNQQR
jgi:hypothetical protein